MPSLPPARSFDIILGGYDLGTHADLIFQGVLFAQFAHYWALYKSDILAIKFFVFGLFLATSLKSVQVIAISWVQNVELFLNASAATNLYFHHWLVQSNFVLVALIGFYVQMFFCYRLWGISKNIYTVVSVVVLLVCALVFACISCWTTFKAAHTPMNNTWIQAHRATVVSGDVFLCGSTAYFLLKHSKESLPQMAGIFNRIIRLTLQSMAPATFCASLNLICSLSGRGKVNTWMMVGFITNMGLPKLYAISAMWTLNSRHDIRATLSHEVSSSDFGGLSDIRIPSLVSGNIRSQEDTESRDTFGLRKMPPSAL
ncbi:hypothetical protein DFH09DRAFT_1393671 [Mycena vulgaris]|nr:hypothetical protein DFH09DRAFT_1393671 [Mycena vulgaris]